MVRAPTGVPNRRQRQDRTKGLQGPFPAATLAHGGEWEGNQFRTDTHWPSQRPTHQITRIPTGQAGHSHYFCAGAYRRARRRPS